jgi:malic enzyme
VLTDEFFRVAAHRLTDMVTPDRVREGALYPRIAELRSVARAIAIAVAEHARACDPRAEDEEPVPALVDRAMWWPAYLPLVSD